VVRLIDDDEPEGNHSLQAVFESKNAGNDHVNVSPVNATGSNERARNSKLLKSLRDLVYEFIAMNNDETPNTSFSGAADHVRENHRFPSTGRENHQCAIVRPEAVTRSRQQILLIITKLHKVEPIKAKIPIHKATQIATCEQLAKNPLFSTILHCSTQSSLL
jgi:hypothetical protein